MNIGNASAHCSEKKYYTMIMDDMSIGGESIFGNAFMNEFRLTLEKGIKTEQEGVDPELLENQA